MEDISKKQNLHPGLPGLLKGPENPAKNEDHVDCKLPRFYPISVW